MPEGIEIETPTQTEPLAGETENAPQTQAVETTTTEPQAGESQQSSPETISLEEARKLRSEAANLRKRLKEADTLRNELTELKKFKEQIETEKLSETEKQAAARQKLEQQLASAQAEKDDLTRQMQELRIQQSVFSQAAKLNIANPNVAAKLLDWSEIEYDDSGNPTNIPALLQQLVKDEPYLVAQQGRPAPTTSGGATNPSRTQTANANLAITEEFVSKLTPETYASLTAEQKNKVQEVIQRRGRR